jgi:glycosidase
VNVTAQTSDPASLLSLYRDLIAIRNAHPALRTGSIDFPSTGKSAVYAALRKTGDDTILVLINLGEDAVTDYKLDITGLTGASLLPLLGADRTEIPLSPQPVAELAPFGVYIFQLK